MIEYTGVQHHKRLNNYLRGDQPLTAETVPESDQERLANLYSALTHPKARMLKDCVLYRKCPIPLSESKIGGRIVDVGFMSCSVSLDSVAKHTAHQRDGCKTVIIAINAKSGERGYIAVNEMTDFIREKEILRYGGVFRICDIVKLDGEEIYYLEEEGGYDIR